MRLVFAPRARRDLLEIGDWIAQDDPEAAVRFIIELEQKARQLVSNPLAYPFAPRLRHLGVRKRSVRGYLILYRVNDGGVRIARIVSGRRDYSVLFRNP